jgi:sugar/nucleoside kinase (ribokinase family)
MLDVLCVGEALWDLHAPAGVPFARAKTVSMRPGGAAVNVAMGLARRGARAGVAAVVGDEALGEALIARLEAAGVDVAGIVRALPRTGVLFAERAAGGARFVGYRSADEPAPALPEDWSARAVLLAGLMPSPDHARTWCRAAREARDEGARVVVDVNARPRVFRGRDPSAALAVLAEADVVKASEGDLAVLALRAEDLRDRMRAEAALVITAGPGPARALGKFGEVVRATEGDADGDPLGAGDAFTVGVLLATLRAERLDDAALWDRALRRGHAVARAHLRTKS